MSSEIKKCFLQACLNHGSIESTDLHKILEPLCKTYNENVASDRESLESFIKDLNGQLDPFNMSLTFVKHPIPKKEYLVFSFKCASDISKQQHHLSQDDRFYFTKLIETIVVKPEYCIDENYALDITTMRYSQQSSGTTLSNPRMIELLKMWNQQGYFLLYNNLIYFGPRMIVEYAAYLKNYFADYVKDCSLCGKLVFWDVKCMKCQSKLHRSCIRHFLIQNSNCPVCKEVWNTRLSTEG